MSRSFRLTERSEQSQPPHQHAAPVPATQVRANPDLRRRWPVRLLVTLLVLGGLFVGANLGTRAYADSQVSSVVKSRTGAQDATVQMGSFPWLVPLFAGGTVNDVVVNLHGVPAGRLDLSTVTVDAEDVHVSRHLLFSQQKVRITGIGSATVTARISAADLSSVTGHTVVISGSRVEASVGSVLIPVAVSVSRTGILSIGVHGATVFQVALDSSRVVPPCPMHLVISGSSVGVSCHVAPVPQSVIDAMH